ncbi:PHB depolymerase family esterase [Vreelandella rituensis]|uniref:Plasmid partitioning protein n=1 Tax=Vreelandella rituensis TaxID=2282306 RepID=A0A368U2Y1_9GAMM|nr:PHB depolymerase family esterase [Halomonas rituensis]RCV91395.1 plasmid partitioning protein [Halomonas rituensis]
MNNPMMSETMREATRLTQAGRLDEAMALIQGSMNGVPGEAFASRAANGTDTTTSAQGETIEGTCEVVDEQQDAQPKASQWKTAEPKQWKTAKPKPTATAKSWSSAFTNLNLNINANINAEPDSPPAPGQFTSGTYKSAVGSRRYKLYIPSSYTGQPLPLVVMLHGCTQDPDDFAKGTDMNRLAEEQLFCVLYPAQPASANTNKCWNWFKASDQQRDGGEPEIIAGMTRKIIEEHHLDSKRVYVAGLSAGGAMATTLAMTHPDLYTAVGVHSGLPHGVAQDLPSAFGVMQGGTGPLANANPSSSSWSSKVPAVIFHGDRDTTVHPSNAERIAGQYSVKATNRRDEVKVESGRVPNGHAYTRTIHHDAKGKPSLEQWQIHGAGHAWSGGSLQGSYTDPKGPDATGEMLRFFYTHAKQ